jgi:DNA-binding PadR family transcriptional regulator
MPKTNRGDDPRAWLPLSGPLLHILVSLSESDRHGYAIMLDVAERSGGAVRLWPASLYGALQRLVRGGLAVPVTVQGEQDPRRRHYRLTAFGRKVLAAEGERLAALARLAKGASTTRR